MNLTKLISSDLQRFSQTFALRGDSHSKWRVLFESLIFKAGFQAVLLYRISHWLFSKRFKYLAWLVARFNLTFTGAEIEFNAKIGPGMFIAHPVGVMIGRGTTIGSDVTIFQGVSFGVKSWHPDSIRKFPTVGDGCFFFAHSIVLGDIFVGNGCVVAAQSVVTQDIPAGALAKGVPAKSYQGEAEELISSWAVSG